MILNPTFGKGATFTPSVSQNGDLSWTNDGGLANPAPVNIRGPVGPKGADGKTGPAGPSFTEMETKEVLVAGTYTTATETLTRAAKFVVAMYAGTYGFVIPGKTGNLGSKETGTVNLSPDGKVVKITKIYRPFDEYISIVAFS